MTLEPSSSEVGSAHWYSQSVLGNEESPMSFFGGEGYSANKLNLKLSVLPSSITTRPLFLPQLSNFISANIFWRMGRVSLTKRRFGE